MRFYIFISFIFVSLGLFSQTSSFKTGSAIIFFESNTPVIIRLDTSLIKSSRIPIELTEGVHIVKSWAPHKKLRIDTIIVKQHERVILAKRLENTDQYNVYKKEKNKYLLKKTATQFVGIPITVGYSAYALIKYNSYKKKMNYHLDNANIAKEKYESSISIVNINMYETEYYSEKEKYQAYLKKTNLIKQQASIVVPIGVIASAGLLYLSAKLIKPTYNEGQLLSLSSFGVNVNDIGEYAFQVNLNMNYLNIKK